MLFYKIRTTRETFDLKETINKLCRKKRIFLWRTLLRLTYMFEARTQSLALNMKKNNDFIYIYFFLIYQYHIQLYFISRFLCCQNFQNHILLKASASQSFFLPFIQRIPFQLKSWSLYVSLNKEIHF